MSKVSLSVLMPAYNEGAGIRASVQSTYGMLKTLKKPFEIVVIDDGSGDWTYEEARKAARGLPGIPGQGLGVNQGKGWALKEAFRKCRGEWVVFLDSDLDIDPRQLKLFFDIQQKQ